jgi:hypothetical protein
MRSFSLFMTGLAAVLQVLVLVHLILFSDQVNQLVILLLFTTVILWASKASQK